MQALVDQINSAIIGNTAALHMEAHLSAYAAYLNCVGNAAQSYASPVGMSVTRRATDEALKHVNDTWLAFREACENGGVDVDAGPGDIGNWRLP